MFVHFHTLTGKVHPVIKDMIVDIEEADPVLWGKNAHAVIVTQAGTRFAITETVAEAEAIVDASK